MEPLYIFIDLEAAHGSNYFGDIIELAAQVDPRVIKEEIFCSFINTRQNLSYFALHISNIKKSDLLTKPYFPEVFKKFMGWISNVLSQCQRKCNKDYFPVLVAHGGFDNDFMMIQSNLERNEISLDVLNENNLHFGDTYKLAQKLKERNVEGLGSCQLSIEKLYKKMHPSKKLIGQHRALPDVQLMIEIFLESKLERYFDEIPIATFEDRNGCYRKNNTTTLEKGILEENLPKGMAKVTHCMTLKRLIRNGLTYARLQSFFESAESTLDFYDKLKDIGIDRKAAKSMASRLASSGLTCRGAIEKDVLIVETDVKDDVNDKECKMKNEYSCGKKCERTDSGYSSVDVNRSEIDLELFYEMFADDFFLPPEVYEYTFGSFSISEIEELDNYIEDLFIEQFGIDEEIILNSTTDDFKQDNHMHSKYGAKTVLSSDSMTELEHKISPLGENWEDEFSDETFSMPAPVKVVPIGMTIDNFSGETFSQRDPLLKHFESFDATSAPTGGIPKPVGKAAKNKQKKCKKMNKKAVNSEQQLLESSGVGRTFAKTSNGEIFILV